MNSIGFFLSLFLWSICGLSAVEIVISLDDHPMPKGRLFSVDERVESYCKAFEKYEALGVFFCIGSACKAIKEPWCLVRLNEAGHFLANHSLNHQHLSSMSLREFQQEIEATDAILGLYSQFRKWFRFPYLDYGNRASIGGSEEKFWSAMELLKHLGYQEGYLTINTFDWYIESCLQKALQAKKNVDVTHLKSAYLFLLSEWCTYYIAAYKKVVPEEITHVLLLHANDLNALFMEDILQMVQTNGWTIVSPEQAFNTPGWRTTLLKKLELIPDKPPSLSTESIDLVLERYEVFS